MILAPIFIFIVCWIVAIATWRTWGWLLFHLLMYLDVKTKFKIPRVVFLFSGSLFVIVNIFQFWLIYTVLTYLTTH